MFCCQLAPRSCAVRGWHSVCSGCGRPSKGEWCESPSRASCAHVTAMVHVQIVVATDVSSMWHTTLEDWGGSSAQDVIWLSTGRGVYVRPSTSCRALHHTCSSNALLAACVVASCRRGFPTLKTYSPRTLLIKLPCPSMRKSCPLVSSPTLGCSWACVRTQLCPTTARRWCTSRVRWCVAARMCSPSFPPLHPHAHRECCRRNRACRLCCKACCGLAE